MDVRLPVGNISFDVQWIVPQDAEQGHYRFELADSRGTILHANQQGPIQPVGHRKVAHFEVDTQDVKQGLFVARIFTSSERDAVYETSLRFRP